jgi:hypothetical protein
MRDEIQEIVEEKADEHDVDSDKLVFPDYKMEALYDISEEQLRKNLDKLMESISEG